jgi:hypothetical protein
MPWATAAAVLGVSNIVGGAMQGEAAKKAAETSSQAQLKAAQIAADAARFRPVGVTTRFGASNFGFDPSGNLSSAGYTVSPELQAYQARLMGLSGGALSQAEGAQQQYAPLQGAAQGLFGLGQQYLAQSPEQVAQQYMAKQQDLLAPSRERQMAQLENRLFNTGRGGLSVGATGMRPGGGAGLGAASPEMEAYYNAIAQQDAALGAQAQQAGQQQVAFGTGLFGTGSNLLGNYQQGQVGALSPFQAYLTGTQGIEGLGQSSLDIGSQLGGRSAQAGANAGNFLLRGGMGAAETARQGQFDPFAYALQGLGQNQQFGQGVANWMRGGTGFTPTQTPYYQTQGSNYDPYGSGTSGAY